MTKYIIAVNAITALGKDVESNQPNHSGKQLDTRKNPHAIAVGLELSLPLS
jgi:hypothetical protein